MEVGSLQSPKELRIESQLGFFLLGQGLGSACLHLIPRSDSLASFPHLK